MSRREQVLAHGRAAAEAGMVDACTIRRRSGGATDPNTGKVTPTYQLIYSGKCRVQQSLTQAEPEQPGQASVLMLRLELQLPIRATGVEVDDEVTVDQSANDPDLLGRVFYARDLAHKTEATARRIGVGERTS